MAASLTIYPAKHGGFLVTGHSDYGDPKQPLFAGTLPLALDFIGKQLEANEGAAAEPDNGAA